MNALAFSLLMLAAATPVAAQDQGGRRDSAIDVPAGQYAPLLVSTVPSVDVARFRVDPTPVTLGDFLDFATVHPEWRRSQAQPLFVGTSYLESWTSDLDPGAELDRPVTEVSWFAARAFCKANGGRLPTTDEWEYLAAMPETADESSSSPLLHRRFLELRQQRPRFPELPAVGRTVRNHLGVWDLHGLVSEWTADFNNQMLTGAGRDDRGLDRGLYCAAGSAGVPDPSDYAAFLRSATRASLDGSTGRRLLGFRCAYPE